jgi:serine/threonine-protein kinase
MRNRSADEYAGRTLGQFEIVEEIGRGGMATVYRARQKSINRMVAIKILPRALLHDSSFYERFTREVDVIARLEHPHILPIYDFGEADGVPYIAMRYLAGGSLAVRVRRSPLTPEQIVRPLGQVAQALDYAHQQGIIHRDLKPGNILLDEQGNAYLSDFGIARVLNSNLTGSQIIGTPAYMSPEQANGLPLDARSDLYSLGIVLFELLTGSEPYSADTPVGLLLKHIGEPLPSLRARRPELSMGIEAVVTKAAAKQPGDRYASASDLANALAAMVSAAPGVLQRARSDEDTPTLMTDLPPRTPPATARPPTLPPQSATAVLQTEPPSAVPAGQRRRLGLIAGAAAALVVLAVLALALIRPQPAPPIVVTPTADLAAATPFAEGQAVESERISLTVPAGWNAVDQRGPAYRGQLWRADDSAYVAVLVYNASAMAGSRDEMIARWEQANAPAPDYRLIDEAEAPDGTLRRSYRVVASTLEAGQRDVFFIERDGVAVVVDLYAADRYGSTLVPLYQQVLDSLRIRPAQT